MSIFSVVIPLYNGKEYICNAIDSVLSQQCNDIEICVINDGSTDDSYETIKTKYCLFPNVIIENQKNSGVGAARNHGLKICSGKYVMFLDQDDFMDKDFYDENIRKMIISSDDDVVAFTYNICNRNGTRYTRISVKNDILIGKGHLMPTWAHHSSLIYNVKYLKQNNICYPLVRFDGDEQFRFLALYNAKKIKFYDKSIFYYRRNPGSETHTKVNIETKMFPIIEAWQKIKKTSQYEITNKDEYLQFCDAVINFQILNCLKYMCMSDQYSIEAIIDKMNNLPAYENFCLSYMYSKSNREKKEEISLWLNHPKKFKKKYRIIGHRNAIRKRASKFYFVEMLFDKKTYLSKYC